MSRKISLKYLTKILNKYDMQKLPIFPKPDWAYFFSISRHIFFTFFFVLFASKNFNRC